MVNIENENRIFDILINRQNEFNNDCLIELITILQKYQIDMNKVIRKSGNGNGSSLFILIITRFIEPLTNSIGDIDLKLFEDIIKISINLGADPNFVNDEGESAIWILCEALPRYDKTSNLYGIIIFLISCIKIDHKGRQYVNPNNIYKLENGTETSLWNLAVSKSSTTMLDILCLATIRPHRAIFEKFEQDYIEGKKRTPISIDEMGPFNTNWFREMAMGLNPVNNKMHELLLPIHLVLNSGHRVSVIGDLLDVLLSDRALNSSEQIRMTLFDMNTTNKFGFTPLHCAAFNGYENAIEKILIYSLHFDKTLPTSKIATLQFQADINAQSDKCGPYCKQFVTPCEAGNFHRCTLGYTPLMCAILNQHSDAVLRMFDKNCVGRQSHDLNGTRANFCQYTALHLACSQNIEMDDVVLSLLQHKANVNVKDEFRYTPLHLATMLGHILISKHLIRYNANVDETGGEILETTLHIAAACGYTNIVNLLLRKGAAEVHAENSKGQTALAHAFKYHSHLSEQLEDQVEKIVLEQIQSSEIILLAKAEQEYPGRSEQIRNIMSRVIQEKFNKKYPGLYHRLVDLLEEIFDDRRSFGSRKDNQKRILKKIRRQKKHLQMQSVVITEEERGGYGKYFCFQSHPIAKVASLEAARTYRRLSDEMKAETLLLQISSQNMLIKLLLDSGADLNHEDKADDPAFSLAARFNWFDTHYKQMLEINNHPNELGYDSEIFRDPRTQAAVRTKYIYVGERTKALKELAYWVVFLVVLTVIAVHYSGDDSYDAISLHTAVKSRILEEEYDNIDMKNFEDVGNPGEWNMFLKKPFLDGLWPEEQDNVFFFSSNGTDAFSEAGMFYETYDNAVFGMLMMLGRPRYRQLRTLPYGCSEERGVYLDEENSVCFTSMTNSFFIRTYGEDQHSFRCASSNGDDLLIKWSSPEAMPSVPIQGKYGYYGGGGFSVILPKNKTAASILIDDLNACNFISMNTRMAVLEFTLYSRSQALFTHARIYLEFTNAGAFYVNSVWDTFKLVAYYDTRDRIPWIIIEVIFLIMYIKYAMSEVTQMTETWPEEHIKSNSTPRWWFPIIMKTLQAQERVLARPKEFFQLMPLPKSLGFHHSICFRKSENWKVPPYLMNPFNYLDMLIIVLLLSFIIVHIQLCHWMNINLPLWSSENSVDVYVDVSDALRLASIRQHLLAVILFICYCKCLEYVQVSAATAIPVLIFGKMVMKLMTFFLIFIIFVLAFGLFDYVMFALDVEQLSSVFKSLVSAFRASLGEIDFVERQKQNHIVATIISIIAVLTLVLVLLNLVIAVMNQAFEECQATAEARWCYMQFRKICNRQKLSELRKSNNRNFLACFRGEDEFVRRKHKTSAISPHPYQTGASVAPDFAAGTEYTATLSNLDDVKSMLQTTPPNNVSEHPQALERDSSCIIS